MMQKYFTGIDVSKDRFSFAIISHTGNIIYSSEERMSREGFNAFLQAIRTHCEGNKVLIGVESSGVYHLNLYHFLLSRNLPAVIINPLLISNFLKYSSLRKCKTDKKDAITIARFLLAQNSQIEPTTNPHNELKELAREAEALTKQIARIKTEIKRVLHILFPELEHHASVFSKSILNLLYSYPSAPSIAELNPQEVKKQFEWKVKISPEDVISLAKNSIGISSPSYEVILKAKISLLIEMQKHLDNISSCFLKKAENTQKNNIEIVSSISGVGELSASYFIAEIGDIRRFPSYKNLIAYAGVDPAVYQSGTSERKKKITKRGNRHLRRILYLIGVNLSIKNPYFRTYYLKKRAEGKAYKMAILSVVHKFIRVVYSMLNNQTKFYLSVEEVAC